MRRRIMAALVGLLFAAGLTVVEAPAAHAIVTGTIVFYEHENYVNILTERDVPVDCDNAGYTWDFPTKGNPFAVGGRMSSVRFYAGDLNNCNIVWLMADTPAHQWYYECVWNGDKGIAHFNLPWNDDTMKVVLRRQDNTCQRYWR